MSIQEILYTSNGAETMQLPSGGEAIVKEMTGHDQRAFMNRHKQLNGVAVQELLANCTDSIKGEALPEDKQERMKIILNMMSGDRHALLFGIRKFSLGTNFAFAAECPQCHQKDHWEVDLSDPAAFPLKLYPKGEQRELSYDSTVAAGLTIKYIQLDGHAEMAALRKRSSVDVLTDLELRQPQAKDGDKWVRIDLNRLTDKLIAEMRKVIRESEGGIDSTVRITCKFCSEEVTFDLLEQPDFLTPNVIS